MKISLIDLSVVKNVQLLRKIIEKEMIKFACNNLNDEIKLHLEKNIYMQKFYFEKSMFDEIIHLDNELHKYLFEISNNLLIYKNISKLYIHYDRIRTLEYKNKIHYKNTIKDHEDLYKAILDCDADFAESIISKHLDRLFENIDTIQKKYPNYFV